MQDSGDVGFSGSPVGQDLLAGVPAIVLKDDDVRLFEVSSKGVEPRQVMQQARRTVTRQGRHAYSRRLHLLKSSRDCFTVDGVGLARHSRRTNKRSQI